MLTVHHLGVSQSERIVWLCEERGIPYELKQAIGDRYRRALQTVDERLAQTSFLAGDDLTAADIMIVFTLTTMRYFHPYDLSAFANIRSYLQRIGERPAYQTAMEKGDPGMALLLT